MIVGILRLNKPLILTDERVCRGTFLSYESWAFSTNLSLITTEPAILAEELPILLTKPEKYASLSSRGTFLA